ncbi:MAG: hypothetical protein H0X39_02175 [Actinobacteria bacterium]|nr:hypothetical protein [Actinomycetota bacterium]
MSRPWITALACAFAVLTVTANSFAAAPKHGATYEGSLFASGTAALTKTVRLTVAASGKTGRVTWICGSGRAHNTLQFAITSAGTFKAYSNTGSLTVWSFVGRFVTPTTARAVLHLNATCDGKGGALNLALHS